MSVRRFGRWLRAGLILLLLPVVFVLGFAALYPAKPPGEQGKTDVIVVLGGGMSGGVLHPSSRDRVLRGVALWQAGLAPRLHITGGTSEDGPSTAAVMADLAVEMGVPREVVSLEEQSYSTLQNALFSQPFLQDAESVRLVTDGFHAPRAWLSFRVMGGQRLYLTPSSRFAAQDTTTAEFVKFLLREALAWWFNLSRYLLWLAVGTLGLLGEEARDGLLA